MSNDKLFVVGHAYYGVIKDSEKKRITKENFNLLKNESQEVFYKSSIMKISESQANSIQNLPPLSGKPIYYNHDYAYGRIGDIIKLYFDSENKYIDIIGMIYNKPIIEKIKSNEIKSFSIGIRQLIDEHDNYVKNISMILDEVSVTENPFDPRCAILVKMNKEFKKNIDEYEEILNIPLKIFDEKKCFFFFF